MTKHEGSDEDCWNRGKTEGMLDWKKTIGLQWMFNIWLTSLGWISSKSILVEQTGKLSPPGVLCTTGCQTKESLNNTSHHVNTRRNVCHEQHTWEVMMSSWYYVGLKGLSWHSGVIMSHEVLVGSADCLLHFYSQYNMVYGVWTLRSSRMVCRLFAACCTFI